MLFGQLAALDGLTVQDLYGMSRRNGNNTQITNAFLLTFSQMIALL
jgi:hypothetical protein